MAGGVVQRVLCCFCPWWRGRNWLLCGLVGSAALSGWAFWASHTDEPASAAGFAAPLGELIRQNQPAGEGNGWEDLLRAHARLGSLREEVEAWARDEVRAGRLGQRFPEGSDPIKHVALEWSASRDEDIWEWYSPHKARLLIAIQDEALERADDDQELIRALRALPLHARFVCDPRPADDGQFFEHPWTLREVTLFLARRAEVARAAHSGSRLNARIFYAGEMIESVELGLAFARGVESHLSFYASVVAQSCRTVHLEQVREWVESGRLTAEQYLELERIIAVQCVLPPASAVVEAGRLITHAEITGLYYSDSGFLTRDAVSAHGPMFLDLFLHWETDPDSLATTLQLPFCARRAVVERLYDEMYDLASASVAGDPGARTALREFESRVPERVPVFPMLAERLMDIPAVRSEAAAVRLMLAIEAYRMRTGAIPQALEDLVPGTIPALPPDPCEPSRTLEYTRLETPDEFGRAYWLHNNDGISLQARSTHWTEVRDGTNALNVPEAFFDE